MPMNMAANNQQTERPSTDKNRTADGVAMDQAAWVKEINRAEKYFRPWVKKADKLYKLYAKQGEEKDNKRKFAMLWANTEVLKPSVYARPPIPQVSRRYKDKDPVGRLAAEILERAAGYEFERMNIDSVLRAVRDDLLLPGRGTAWVRYEAEIEEPDAPEEQGTPAESTAPNASNITPLQAVSGAPGTTPAKPPEPTITEHKTVVDYVHYSQFLHAPARRWEEVPWVARIEYMSAKDGKARFGKTWDTVPMDAKDGSTEGGSDGSRDPQLKDAAEPMAAVYEVWSKKDEKVYFIAKGAKDILQVDDPLLDFEGFFPCPKPVYATVTNNDLIPTPDYKYYQDQAEEIDQLTARIGELLTRLKVVGFYPAGAEGDVSAAMEKALSPSTESQMIPVASWAAFGERGGGNAIVWLPIRDIVETINACIATRNQCVQDVYQITGISDILRGATQATETATAQSIKAQWGSVRIRDRQQELVRFARDLTRMVCEVIGEHYDGQYLVAVSNVETPQPPQQPPQPPPTMGPPPPTGNPQQDQAAQQQFQQAQQAAQQLQQQFQQAMQAYQAEMQKLKDALALIADDDVRSYRIEIETDSTIQPDEDAEKQRRTEFVTAIGGLMQQAIPMLQIAPELAPLISETIQFTARGFRAGRQLEDQIEQAFTALSNRLANPPQQQQGPDPAQAALQLKQKQQEQDLQYQDAKNKMDLQHRQDAHQQELKLQAEKHAHTMAITQQTNELGLNAGKAKLRDQILAEEQQSFLGQPGEQVNGVAQVLQTTLGQMMEAVQNSNHQVLASNSQLLQAMTAPKVITTPDGRQYTAQTLNA